MEIYVHWIVDSIDIIPVEDTSSDELGIGAKPKAGILAPVPMKSKPYKLIDFDAGEFDPFKSSDILSNFIEEASSSVPFSQFHAQIYITYRNKGFSSGLTYLSCT